MSEINAQEAIDNINSIFENYVYGGPNSPEARKRNKYLSKVIQKAIALLQAEADGLLVRLPCKVGDRIYSISHFRSGIVTDDIISITVFDSGFVLGCARRKFDLNDRGSKWVLTREEAEKVLGKINTK